MTAIRVLTLLVLAPISAEYLAAYDDSTGDIPFLLGGLLVLAPLYGAPALLIREVSRRRGLGWPSMILLSVAFGVVQAGLVDQSLFSEDYRGIETWKDFHLSTYIDPLGISAYDTFGFITGHLIYSICVPIFVAEHLRSSSSTPWLGRRMLALMAVLYAIASVLVLQDHLSKEDQHANPIELAVCALLAIALVVLALRIPKAIPPETRQQPPVWAVGLIGIAFAAGYSSIPFHWFGFLAAMIPWCGTAYFVIRRATRQNWNSYRWAALVLPFLLVRAIQAFTYYPLIGHVSSVAKYGHNIVMLAIVLAAGGAVLAATRHEATTR